MFSEILLASVLLVSLPGTDWIDLDMTNVRKVFALSTIIVELVLPTQPLFRLLPAPREFISLRNDTRRDPQKALTTATANEGPIKRAR